MLPSRTFPMQRTNGKSPQRSNIGSGVPTPSAARQVHAWRAVAFHLPFTHKETED